MARLMNSCCGKFTLRRGTINILIFYLTTACVYLLADVYDIVWKVSKLSSKPDAISLILLVKYCSYVGAVLVALFGLRAKKAEFLMPVIVIRAIIIIEDVIDLIWYCFKKRTAVPTSLPIFYTESYLVEIIFGVFIVGLSTYFIVVMYSYCEELRNETNSQKKEPLDESETSIMTTDVHLAATIPRT